jgi:hypothetical protein
MLHSDAPLLPGHDISDAANGAHPTKPCNIGKLQPANYSMVEMDVSCATRKFLRNRKREDAVQGQIGTWGIDFVSNGGKGSE